MRRASHVPLEELAPYLLTVPLPGRCREPSGTSEVRLGSPDLLGRCREPSGTNEVRLGSPDLLGRCREPSGTNEVRLGLPDLLGRCREPSGTNEVRLGSPDLPPLDWRDVFGNDHPVELEVGFGKGLFLLTAAQAHPEFNFAGVEIVRKYQLFTATRLAKRGLHNVRVACADVLHFLPHGIAAQSLQAVHVYFPDPWWKKRHHKRRIFTSAFVTECIRVLRPGGQLYAATDVEEYAQVMAGVLADQAALRPLPAASEHTPNHDLDYLTNFERKFRKQGKPIFRMRYESVVLPI